jgi:DNA-binding LytR/AlgR family response regulator
MLNLIGEYNNATEAKNSNSIDDVDLILMDVELPMINGFKFLDLISKQSKKQPEVIITTKSEQYAVTAFEYNAIDYIIKPVSELRFEKAIEKAVWKLKCLENFVDKNGDHIFVKSNLKKRKVYVNEIKWVEALGDYVKVVTNENSYVVLSTMKAFDSELPKNKFLRIHKSYIININKIERYNSRVVEIDSTQIPLSRNKKQALSKVLEGRSSSYLH